MFLHNNFAKFIKKFYDQVTDDIVQNNESMKYSAKKLKTEAFEDIESLEKRV